jgi:hypothetical protein
VKESQHPPASEQSDDFNVRISKFAAVIIALGMIVSATVLGSFLLRQPAETNRRTPPTPVPVPTTIAATTNVTSGEWGDLILHSVKVEKPDAYVATAGQTNGSSQWIFRGIDPARLVQLFTTAGLPAGEVARLTTAPAMVVAGDRVTVTPGRDLVMALSPDSRRLIYAALAQFGENQFQAFPFTFRKDGVDEWFADSGLATEYIAAVKRLIYQRGEALCFSDLAEVLATIPDPDQRRRLVKTLSRQSTILMKLRVQPGTDVDKLLAYWGRGAVMKDARPLLESLREVPGGATIDIVHLLPPFARRRLYTYPFPATRPEDGGEDCHWTTMNFFADAPDMRFRDKQVCLSTLMQDYYAVSGPPRYGDVAVFVDAQGNAIHSAIYVAADILFTKNGANHFQPWTLMRTGDILASYPTDQPLRTMYWRDKRY